MALGSWIGEIQGLATLLTGSAAAIERRKVLKVHGNSVFDDGVQNVLGGVQVITGSGTWDGHSSRVLIKGSGARLIAVPDPSAGLNYDGLLVEFIDSAGNSAAGTITLDPAGTGQINGSSTSTIIVNNQRAALLFRATGDWQRVS
jgi:hypothetical protein